MKASLARMSLRRDCRKVRKGQNRGKAVTQNHRSKGSFDPMTAGSPEATLHCAKRAAFTTAAMVSMLSGWETEYGA